MDKPSVDYPCSWPFKVIGSDAPGIQDHIGVLLKSKDCTLKVSQQSKQGKYTSFNLSVYVASEAERNTIYAALKDIPTVKLVL